MSKVIKHILLWTFSSGVKDSEKDNLINEVRLSGKNLEKNIKELSSVEVYKNVASSDFDFIYIATVENEDDLVNYQNHPLHQEHKKRFLKVLTKPVVFDYEL